MAGDDAVAVKVSGWLELSRALLSRASERPAIANETPAPDEERASSLGRPRRALGTSNRSATWLAGPKVVHRHDLGRG
jgi:hypothetical protein